ncbi:enoyl-CoA hydratase [Pasteurellaceae bacterium USgator11]|nr:enoyl-CoA hydratase [Pasteurellaceae bacterium USgator41]TNG96939.1 enoyl-CoA hydratase [Pasteurellaceae bacterium UScroc12]TNG97857.1 enoyl-CoA hydratase [Pasteurellaceae bacterium UScroc31]TNH02910.1 enoyl-CoA hydratase [Pasteurellaceae bacterium USgator11]
MTSKVYLALYKGKKSGWKPKDLIARLSDWLTRRLTRGEYSHCEIAVQKQVFVSGHHYDMETYYDCYSASIRDGGVRCKVIDVESDKWDLVLLSGVSEAQIQLYFELTKGKKYDWFGAIGVVFGTAQRSDKFFCSEWCSNAINRKSEGWRFSPNDLAAIFK